ncbi:AI-2E family transporter [Anaerovoracaceae bacterium 42-11]|nr:AI-2E family transporter [Emergencia sp.]
MKERFQSHYAKLGLTIFASGAALTVLYEGIIHLDSIRDAWSEITSILFPFIFGLVVAYLLCPIYNAVVRRMYSFAKTRFRQKRTAFRLARVVGTLVSLFVFFGVVGGLFAMVLPETIRSIVGLVQEAPDKFNDLILWIENTFTAERFPELAGAAETILSRARDSFMLWTENEFLPKIGDYMTQISQGVIVTVRTLMNMFIGVIICVYFLNSKELFKAQTKKLIAATMSRKQGEELQEFANFCNKTFGGFINGKLIDSLIIGILCFILMTVFGLPYAVLVSTIVGVTNIIPFFGPFIGAVPSAVIICFSSPMQALYFLLLILALQQFDGNILGPKILGGTTGLASFWVLFAILMGGGLFGFVGMVLGVPVCAVAFYYLNQYLRKRLIRKRLPADTVDYQDFNKYDINRKDIL